MREFLLQKKKSNTCSFSQTIASYLFFINLYGNNRAVDLRANDALWLLINSFLPLYSPLCWKKELGVEG